MHPELAILVNLTVSLSAALVLGFITQKLKLSPILGYLLAGIAIGPQTPGFVADQESAAQFAEIGVILLMFGVGMHFDTRDLLAVRRVAIPGAIGQIAVATLSGMAVMAAAGYGWGAGAVMGMAVSVASTVVLIRGLTDTGVLQSSQGHIAVGWLIVEDLATVFLLVMLPAIATVNQGDGGGTTAIALAFGGAVIKIAILGVVVLWAGRKVIPWVLAQVARTRMRELFTLTILVVALSIAMGSAIGLGVSVALGAFLAGMVVGQSEVSHQAAADALPMRDAFAVLFFVSVGMLFDPGAVLARPGLFAGLLAVILLAKPVAAVAIVWSLGYSVRTALTVAIGLAQIGEFSFILAELAADHNLMSAEAQSVMVACAILSIAINPLLFRLIGPVETWLRRRPRAWRLLSGRSEARVRDIATITPSEADDAGGRAIVVGYGPVGRTAFGILKEFGIRPVIVDLNVDAVADLSAAGELAVYGDATQRDILAAAGVATARYLLVTVPEIETRTVIVIVARELNPQIKIFVRARYLEERAWLEEIGATRACFEEAETAIGLATLLLREVGASEDRIRTELDLLRARLAVQQETELGARVSAAPDGQVKEQEKDREQAEEEAE